MNKASTESFEVYPSLSANADLNSVCLLKPVVIKPTSFFKDQSVDSLNPSVEGPRMKGRPYARASKDGMGWPRSSMHSPMKQRKAVNLRA